MAISAPGPPWYPRASVATLPFCRRPYSGFPFTIRSTGTPNIWDAVASYIFPCVANTSLTHCSPANHAITLASMAEKSATTNLCPSEGMKAVRISWDRVSGTFPYNNFKPS